MGVVLGLGIIAACGGSVAPRGSTAGDGDRGDDVGGASTIDGGHVRDGGRATDGGHAADAGQTRAIDASGDGGVEEGGWDGRVPTNHRPDDSQCATPVGPGDCGFIGPPDASGPPQFDCTADSQCTEGTNGRCNNDAPAPFAGCQCSYDTCQTDSDCPSAQLCVCHGSPYSFGGNFCTPGTCRVDADCGEHGFCSPSEGGTATCGGVVGYFCHTAKDECLNDSDCTDGRFEMCMWSMGDERWECTMEAVCA